MEASSTKDGRHDDIATKMGRLLLETNSCNSIYWFMKICDIECLLAQLNNQVSLASVTPECYTEPLPKATLTMDSAAVEAVNIYCS